jgi:mono/diheme cytochrome c family protein
MKRIANFGALALSTAVLFGGGTALAASAENGKKMYMQVGCWGCHGMVGQGGVTGPKLAPGPLPYEAFSAFIRSTNRRMPPYREPVLSNADLADIYAYLQTMPKTADYKSIPLLNR